MRLQWTLTTCTRCKAHCTYTTVHHCTCTGTHTQQHVVARDPANREVGQGSNLHILPASPFQLRCVAAPAYRTSKIQTDLETSDLKSHPHSILSPSHSISKPDSPDGYTHRAFPDLTQMKYHLLRTKTPTIPKEGALDEPQCQLSKLQNKPRSIIAVIRSDHTLTDQGQKEKYCTYLLNNETNCTAPASSGRTLLIASNARAIPTRGSAIALAPKLRFPRPPSSAQLLSLQDRQRKAPPSPLALTLPLAGLLAPGAEPYLLILSTSSTHPPLLPVWVVAAQLHCGGAKRGGVWWFAVRGRVCCVCVVWPSQAGTKTRTRLARIDGTKKT